MAFRIPTSSIPQVSFAAGAQSVALRAYSSPVLGGTRAKRQNWEPRIIYPCGGVRLELRILHQSPEFEDPTRMRTALSACRAAAATSELESCDNRSRYGMLELLPEYISTLQSLLRTSGSRLFK